jgi:DNA primase
MFLETLINNLHKSIYRFPEVIQYLYSRHVTDEEIHEYNIGYNKIVIIPEDSCEDRKRMVEECYGGRKLERKIIFPLRDSMDNTVGLIGRSIDTKEFEIFVTDLAKFTGFFFGLDQAFPYIDRDNRVFLVEGPFDLFALLKVFPNTIATLTSWLSEAQYKYLRFFCDNIITVFDQDPAGRHGQEKACDYEGVVPMNLGVYKDPARCLEKQSLPDFKRYVLRQAPVSIS